jgi:hypothetical protein
LSAVGGNEGAAWPRAGEDGRVEGAVEGAVDAVVLAACCFCSLDAPRGFAGTLLALLDTGEGTGVGARGTISGPMPGWEPLWAARGRKLRRDPDVLAATLSDS